MSTNSLPLRVSQDGAISKTPLWIGGGMSWAVAGVFLSARPLRSGVRETGVFSSLRRTRLETAECTSVSDVMVIKQEEKPASVDGSRCHGTPRGLAGAVVGGDRRDRWDPTLRKLKLPIRSSC